MKGRFGQSSDEALASALSQGSAQAFEQLYCRYWAWLLNMALRQLRDRAIAEELVQDVFVGLWERRDQEIILNIKAYLAKAVKFAVFKHVLREKRRSEIIHLHYYQAQQQDDEAMLEARFTEEFVNGVVDRLPDKCRQVFRKSRLDGLSIPQIADELGVSAKTVEGHLTKALKTIRLSLRSIVPTLLAIFMGEIFR